jgi:hypothetical protein
VVAWHSTSAQIKTASPLTTAMPTDDNQNGVTQTSDGKIIEDGFVTVADLLAFGLNSHYRVSGWPR